MSLQINNTGFKAAAAPVSYNNRYTPPMSEENVMNGFFHAYWLFVVLPAA